MARNGQIHGWKEIGAYLSRDERTAKRWEKQRGLPVRRIPGGGRANVYMLVSELDAWLQGDWKAERTDPAQAAAPAPTDDPAAPARSDTLPDAGSSVDRLAEADAAATCNAATPLATSAGSASAASQIGHEHDIVGTAGGSPAKALSPSPLPSARRFRMSQHAMLIASTCGLVLLLLASALRFFHVQSAEARLAVLDSPEAAVRTRGHIPAPEADRLYLQGTCLYEQRTPESLAGAQRLFEQAIAVDPKFAPSYAGLANTFLLLREYATLPADEAYARAKVAADHALVLDPQSAEAHTALGFIDFFSLWKSEEAEREFRVALEADPDNAQAHHWYGSMLMHQGRFGEALVQLDLAQHLNPTSTAIIASKSLALAYSGHPDEANKLLGPLLAAGSHAAGLHRNLAYISLQQPRSLVTFPVEMRRFAELRQDQAALALWDEANRAFARGGGPAMWAAILEHERQTHPDPKRPSYLMAKATAALGHGDEALAELDRLRELHDADLIGLAVDPAFAGLRRDTRFERIASEVGLALPMLARR